MSAIVKDTATEYTGPMCSFDEYIVERTSFNETNHCLLFFNFW
jgi:hypothetical protein